MNPPHSTADSLPPAQRRAVVFAILALHGAAGWGLLQVAPVRQALADAAPMFVDLLAAPAPEKPPEPPPPPPRPIPKTPPPPAPLVTTASPLEPAPFVAPPTPPEPAPPAPPEPPTIVAAPAPPEAPAPAPPAREIPAAAIQYLEPPAPVYPRSSRRLNESGLVIVRVYVDVDGLPRAVQLLQSSGFVRLDEAAVEGVRKARFRPYSENGKATAGWARIPIPFELEK